MNRPYVFLVDLLILVGAYAAAFFVRMQTASPVFGWMNAAIGVLPVLALQTALLTAMRLNRSWRWRMRGGDLPQYATVFLVAAAVLVVLRVALPEPTLAWVRPPYSVTLVDAVFGFCGILAFRFLRERYCHELYDPMRLVADSDVVAGREELKGKVVMVTGAGGTIGGEIVRQAVNSGAAKVLMVERSENALYRIELEVRGEGMLPLMIDINEQAKVEAAVALHRPDVIFHAAAYKHVPMCEWNEAEARRNNVEATEKLVGVARRLGVPKLVLISTDKAVNPTSVMGKTKREAEKIVLAAGYACVRFGNVFGSSGSVIELWKEQIERGGPVTVTDERMTRYFMSVREAVSLVFEAALTMPSGRTYVLDMGKPKSILKMAELMIRFAGYRPYVDIPIRMIGIRPGEKIEEELGLDDAEVIRTSTRKIYCCLTSPR